MYEEKTVEMKAVTLVSQLLTARLNKKLCKQIARCLIDNVHTKFETSSFTHSKNVVGVPKFEM